MNDQTVSSLTQRLKTIKNMASYAETRELCGVLIELVSSLPEAEKPTMGFGGKTAKVGDEQ